MRLRISTVVVRLNARGFMKKAISIGAALGLCCPMQTPGMGAAISSSLLAAPADSILYVPGSTAKVCQFTGQTDKEFNQPTVSQTEKRFGLVGTDRGYSFEHNGIIFFLFGDSPPSATFNGQPNAQTDTPRVADDNDAIAYCSDIGGAPCVALHFITNQIGAFMNPVVLDAHGKPAVTLRTNETPIAGISDAGRMYVLFGTDNFLSNPPGGTSSPNGGATRSVVAVSDDSARTFHFVYNFSRGPDAKFIMTAIAPGQDGYLYFWGTQGDTIFRHSPPFLARKPIGSMGDSTAIEYLSAVNANGTPVFMAGENRAIALFHDSLPGPGGSNQVKDCMGEVGVEWNTFVHRWVMLYNSSNNTTSNPRGIYMRLALHPWGPWSAPQTIFNPERDNGFCYFIHRAVTQSEAACDSLSGTSRLAIGGGNYAPYFISRFTTGDSVLKTSTFYYVMSTWNPYNTVIMKSSIQGSPATGVSITEPTPPATFNLGQNYPNPFNPTTVILYQLPATGAVTLRVYDILGQLVATLVDETKPAGSYTVQFNASGLASGEYVYRLTAASYEQSREMLLLK